MWYFTLAKIAKKVYDFARKKGTQQKEKKMASSNKKGESCGKRHEKMEGKKERMMEYGKKAVKKSLKKKK